MALCISSYTEQEHETQKCRHWYENWVWPSRSMDCRLCPWLSGSGLSSSGTWHGVCWENEESVIARSVLRTAAYVNIKMRGWDKTLSWYRERGCHHPGLPMQGDPSISSCEHRGGGISVLPMSWTALPPCPREGTMSGHRAGSLGSAPIREEAFLCPGKPLVKDNQARCHRANSDGIKAVMKFTAGLASPSNGPAPQWHIVLLARM